MSTSRLSPFGLTTFTLASLLLHALSACGPRNEVTGQVVRLGGDPQRGDADACVGSSCATGDDEATPADADGGGAVMKLANGSLVYSEIGAPTATITIERSGDTSGPSTCVVSTAPSSIKPAVDADNYDMLEHWGDGVGTQLFDDARAILRQPAYTQGMFFMYASHDSMLGNGRIFYDASADTLEYAEYGDSNGAAVLVAAPQTLFGQAMTGDPRFRLTSANGHWVYVVVFDSSRLRAAGDRIWTVKVTGFRKHEIFIYPGPNGDWTGFDDDGGSPG